MTEHAYGLGLATVTESGTVLDTWYPTLGLGARPADADTTTLAALATPDAARGVRREVVDITIDVTAAPETPSDAYLRLHLLSHRLVKPHDVNLAGAFGVLTNVVWTSAGPCAVDGFETTRAKLKAEHGAVSVFSIDKFPRMTDYVVPTGVRIGDADRVRLGAHLAEGTTVMHEGFVNFNAGTLGASMVEGRISAGVVVDDGTDLGGGASIMGTLSGGGEEVISIGTNCLIGANAGVGVSLGNNCVVEAGLYLTAGTKVTVEAEGGQQIRAARDLSGISDMRFWRNSQTGAVEAKSRSGKTVELNEELHKN